MTVDTADHSPTVPSSATERTRASSVYFAGGEPTPLDRLETLLGGTLPPDVEEARGMVKRSALMAAQDVAINQHILKRALEAGDVFLQRLFSMAQEPAPGYQRGERAVEPPAGLLLNRTA